MRQLNGDSCQVEVEEVVRGRLPRHFTRWVARTFLGIGLSGILLYLAARNIDLSSTLHIVLNINLSYIILSSTLYLIATWIRAWRWMYLFVPKRPSVRRLFAATAVGYMLNNILPARLGDVGRAYYLAREKDVTFIPAFATVVVERILDVFGLIILATITSFFVPYPLWVIRGIYFTSAIGISMAALLIGLRLFPVRCARIVMRFEALLPERLAHRLSKAGSSFVSGLGALNMGRHLVSILFISVALWVCYVLFVVPVFWSFGWTMPLGASLAVLVFMSLAMVIPSAPGQLGVVQFFVVIALAFYGLKGSAALGFSIVLHGAAYVTVTIVGLYYAIGQQLSLSQLARLEAQRSE